MTLESRSITEIVVLEITYPGIILFSKLKNRTEGLLAISADGQPDLFTRKSIAFVILSSDISIQFGCLLKAKRATFSIGLLILKTTLIARTNTVFKGSNPISLTSCTALTNLVCSTNAVRGRLVT
ncbi:hypothetical protein CFP56_011914 [Quercus suber]|uniref:Uncharacterized protein n=1 Tax=Quercus suber TaxID=58331 RepID=A0AAW0KY57_QUESU